MSYDKPTDDTWLAFDRAIEAVEELHQALQDFRRTRKYKFLPTMGGITSDVGSMVKDLPVLRERFSDNLEDQGLVPEATPRRLPEDARQALGWADDEGGDR